MLHMIIEQTDKYPMRMQYNPETGKFVERGHKSLQYERNFNPISYHPIDYYIVYLFS